jgi:hypothetical protein
MLGKAGDIGMVVVDQVFSGVNQVAGIVCIVGIVLFALSYLVQSEPPSQRKPTGQSRQPQQPQQPQPQQPEPPQQPVIEAEFIKEEKKEIKESEPGEDNGHRLSSGEEGKPGIEPETK